MTTSYNTKKTTKVLSRKKMSRKGNVQLPWWLSGKESACQCRRDGLDLIREDHTCCGAAKPMNDNY